VIDPLTLDQLRVFVAVAEAGSFRGAAQRLRRVQSAVSHALASLEAQLGVRLFDRSGRRPVLTAEGQTLLGDARALLLKADVLRARARGLGQKVELKLTVALDPQFPLPLAAAALKAVHQTYPTAGVQTWTLPLGSALAALRSRQCALAVTGADIADPTIELSFLADIPRAAVAAPDHPLAQLAAGGQPLTRIAFEVDSGGRSVRELELRSSGTLSWVVPSGRRLLGTVRDGRGEPVSSLALAWVSADGTSWTVTAEDGSFVLSRVSPSEGRLFALDTFGGEALLYQGPPAPQPLDVIYSRWQVLGRVENPDSLPQLRGTFAVRPLRSAMFSPSEIRSLHRPVAISADGRFEMTLPEGEWVAEILPRSADAPALVFRTGPAHAGQELTIVLPLSSTR